MSKIRRGNKMSYLVNMIIRSTSLSEWAVTSLETDTMHTIDFSSQNSSSLHHWKIPKYTEMLEQKKKLSGREKEAWDMIAECVHLIMDPLPSNKIGEGNKWKKW